MVAGILLLGTNDPRENEGMNVRKWPSYREPPPGWEYSPELSEIYGYSVIVRSSQMSRARNKARAFGGKRESHLSKQGKRQMKIGGALMGLGLLSMYARGRMKGRWT